MTWLLLTLVPVVVLGVVLWLRRSTRTYQISEFRKGISAKQFYAPGDGFRVTSREGDLPYPSDPTDKPKAPS